jgi:hypothetical protein
MLQCPAISASNGPAKCPCRPKTAARNRCARWPRTLTLAVLALFASGAAAQDKGQSASGHQGVTNPNAAPASGTTISASPYGNLAADEDAAGEEPATAAGQSSAVTISSERIIEILEQNPDLMVELKSLVADRLAGQGVELSADDISDEMFYSQKQRAQKRPQPKRARMAQRCRRSRC